VWSDVEEEKKKRGGLREKTKKVSGGRTKEKRPSFTILRESAHKADGLGQMKAEYRGRILPKFRGKHI